MSIALPLIGVFLAALIVYFSLREPVAGSDGVQGNRWLGLGAIGVLLAGWLGFATSFGPDIDRPWGGIGAWLGVLAAMIGSLPLGVREVARGFSSSRIRASACVGIAAGMCAHLLPEQGVAACQLSLIAGIGLGAILSGGYAAALGATAVVALDRFGSLSAGAENLALAGSIIGFALLLSAAAEAMVPKNVVEAGIAFAFPLFGFLSFTILFKDQPLAATGVFGIVSGVVLAVLIPKSEPVNPISAGIGALISVGLATAAFALDKGTGMAAAFLGAAGFLLILGNARAVLALGPLFGLVLFRLFQNLYPDTSKAFDIGQHYALIGLMIGAVVPLILIDATPLAERARAKGIGALGVLALIVMALVPILTVFLGPTGAAGLVVGLGFAGVFELVRQGSSLLALSAGSGMAGVMLVSYGWLAKSLDLTRDEKIRILAWSAGGILVLSLLAVLLLRSEPLKEKE